MSDIVEQLRTRGGWFSSDGTFFQTAKTMLTAADEIESLRQRVKELEFKIECLELSEASFKDSFDKTYEELSALKAGQGEPVSAEYQDREGNWKPFVNEEHKANTVADGSWPIRYLYTATTIPEGYALVPIEPTPDMIRKGIYAWYDCTKESENSVWIACYKAMLAAAPKP